MYVCPSCSEEIPDRLKKSAEECPFCHTAWPPEETEPEEPEEPPKPAGWGDEFRPSPGATAQASGASAEPEKSSKGLIIAILLVLLVAGGGAGYYFGVVRGKGDKGAKGGKGPSGPTEEEFLAMQTWYNNAQKAMHDYLVPVCAEYHNAGYQFHSKLTPVKSYVERGGKRLEQVSFKVQLEAAGKGEGEPNIFECPYRIAMLQKDHPFVLEAAIWERKEVFGAVLNYADIEVKGKLTGYLKSEDGKPQTKFRSLASQTIDGFSFPGLKKAPDPGLQALAQQLPMKVQGNTFTLANLTFNKTAPGRYLIGTWELTLTTDEITRRFSNFAPQCEVIRRQKFAKLAEPKAEHEVHRKIYEAGRTVMRDLCKAIENLNAALDPWKESDVEAANTLLRDAHKKWNEEVFNVLKETAEATKSTLRAKAL